MRRHPSLCFPADVESESLEIEKREFFLLPTFRLGLMSDAPIDSRNFCTPATPAADVGVSDVALERTPARRSLFPGGPFFEYGRKSLQFDRIAQFRAGTMRFQHTDRFRINLIPGINAALQLD